MARRNEGIIAILMILALIAFIIGSAIGISISLNEHDNQTNQNNNTTHVENVTSQMLSNNSSMVPVEYDYDLDSVDYNENYTNKTI